MQDKDFLDMLEQHRHEFYGFVRRQVSNLSDSDDVFSAAVLTAYEHRHSFQLGTNFRAWMYKIIVNHCFVANRQDRRTGQGLNENVLLELSNDEQQVYSDILADPRAFMMRCGDEVVQALDVLRPIERVCFLLLAAEKYTYQEIAEIVEIPVATVGTYLARGRAKLRTQLSQYAREQGFQRKSKRDQAPPLKKGGCHGS